MEKGTSAITAVWANEGGDKVAQDELRATLGKENLTGHVLNSTWNGSTIIAGCPQRRGKFQSGARSRWLTGRKV